MADRPTENIRRSVCVLPDALRAVCHVRLIQGWRLEYPGPGRVACTQRGRKCWAGAAAGVRDDGRIAWRVSGERAPDEYLAGTPEPGMWREPVLLVERERLSAPRPVTSLRGSGRRSCST